MDLERLSIFLRQDEGEFKLSLNKSATIIVKSTAIVIPKEKSKGTTLRF